MKIKGFCLLFLSFLLGLPSLWAWDLELGGHRTKPQIQPRPQTYKSDAGQSLIYSPEVTAPIFGQTVTVGLGFEHLWFELAQAQFGYQSHYYLNNVPVSLSPEVTQSQLGVYFQADRELAGFFIGGGVSQYEESFTYLNENYSQSGNQLFLKGGLVLIFGPIRVRADHAFTKLGAHLLQTSSVGLVFHF
ncbi:MAG: hypothetical protein A2527_00450 [Candidatus Lambdaproteobacteria bacterium RIFOXYD2_FULL_50_16]|uniref:Outer membrane protein beta-barrel domain-containing protein n=1 Tax=Candidatus Lambdaproteobacteria bacterium RIFOXYD2_FULL_50_16 TaxID=1817772 RepID=A0A1F6GFK7_9PROT|nr:MAG: hypothetical protein A2527_00450 [Candidatus Lambdaproteobacteria bacterium RIFOXYD2_FULL_50_16]